MDCPREAAAWTFSGNSRGQGGTGSCAGKAVITHPEKLMFPEDGITKGDLAAYYEMIAPQMLPHLRGRPITMERYHRGIATKGFFQKDVTKGFPAWLERVEVRKRVGRCIIRLRPT